MDVIGCIKTGKCVIDDKVNEFLEKAKEADGFIFGSPVHFAAISGALSSFMDRVFYGRGNLFANKVAAGVVSCRRGGATAAFDEINKYFLINRKKKMNYSSSSTCLLVLPCTMFQ